MFSSSLEISELPLSECTYDGIPNIANNSDTHFIAVDAATSRQGKANGNLEYSSTTVNMSMFLTMMAMVL